MAIMAGTIHDRISANFQFLKNAITKAEKNAAREAKTTATLTLTSQKDSFYLIRNSLAEQFRVI